MPNLIPVAGYGIVFGGADLHGDTFTPHTDFQHHLVPQLPVYWDHALDEPEHVLGHVARMVKTDHGLWMEMQLDRTRLYDEMLQLIAMGKVGLSTGSVAHLVRAEHGTIKQWPLVEVSLTVTPAEPRTRPVTGDGRPETEDRGPETEDHQAPVAGRRSPVAGQRKSSIVKGVYLMNGMDTQEWTQTAGMEMETEDGRPGTGDRGPGTEDGRREIGDGRREIGDGRREIGDGRREIGDGRREIGDRGPETEDSRPETDEGRWMPKDYQSPVVSPQSPVSGLRSPDPSSSYIKHLESTLHTLEGRVGLLQQQLEAPVMRNGGYIVDHSAPTTAQAKAIKSFHAYVRRGIKAAMQEGTDSEGGYLVPEQYSNELVAALKDASILRAAGARLLKVAGTDSFKVPTMTQSAAAVLTNEESAFDEKEPTVGEVTFTPYKLTRLAKVSDELLSDSRIDVVNHVLIPDFAQAFAAAENSYFTTGTGTAQPQGIVTGGTVTTTATTATFVSDDIIRLYHALPHAYRQRAVWLANDAVIQTIRQMREGATSGQYLWQSGLQAGQPDRLLGRPVYTLNTMDDDATTTGQNILIFADLDYYWVVDFGSESIRRLDELYAANGQIGFRSYRRVDGHVMLAEAVRILQVK